MFFPFIFIPLLVLYLGIAVGTAAFTLRQVAQNVTNSTVLDCPHHGRGTPGYCRSSCARVVYEINPDAGKVDCDDLPFALLVGAVWPVSSLPALVWWLATRTPTPLAERTRLEMIERRYNEDQEKLTRAGHDDLDEALAEAESAQDPKLKALNAMRKRLADRGYWLGSS